jgi:hypothetical protein
VSDPGPALVAVERGDLAVDKVPIDLAGELRRFVLEVDDLVQPRSNRSPDLVVSGFFGRIVLLRGGNRIMFRQKRGISKMKSQVSASEAHKTLQSQNRP